MEQTKDPCFAMDDVTEIDHLMSVQAVSKYCSARWLSIPPAAKPQITDLRECLIPSSFVLYHNLHSQLRVLPAFAPRFSIANHPPNGCSGPIRLPCGVQTLQPSFDGLGKPIANAVPRLYWMFSSLRIFIHLLLLISYLLLIGPQ